MSTGVQRWAELRDRESLGEPISELELQECEVLERDDASARAQAAPYRELSHMLEHASLERPTAQDRDMVDRVLSSVRVTSHHPVRAAVDADAEIERAVDPEGPTWIRPTAVAISALLPAAAAVALMFYEPKTTPAKGPVTTQLATKASAPTVVSLAQARTAARGPRLFRSGRVLPWQADLVEGDRIESGANAACLVVDPGVDVCLAPSSEVKLTSLSRSERAIEVQRGHAIARLDKQAPGDGFELRAGDVRALAQGTIYSLERNPEGELRVRVLEGRVKVLAAQREIPLSAMQVAIYPDPQQEPSVSALLPGQAARLWELLSTRATVDDGTTKPPPDASVASALPGSDAVERAPATMDRAPSSADGRRAASEPVAFAPPIDARTRLREAWEQLKTKRWADAAATYTLILREFPKSEEAHVVLVRLGDLQLDRLGQPLQALASYERYLREGGGPLEAEARFGVVQALSRLGRVGAERAAIEAYLAKHPTSLKAVTLRERLRNLPR